MQHKDDLMAELLLRLCRELSFPANAYRLILPKYPLSTNGPSHSDCASAGSYVVGRRMEAERLHRILYTALHPKATAVEIMDPPPGRSPNETATRVLEEAKSRRYQLFKITVRLKCVST